MLRLLITALAVLAAAPASWADAGERQAQREQIQRERQAGQAKLQQAESVCYRQFAVADCLRTERAKARRADSALHQQELRLDDADRREKAGERLRSIEEKQREQREKLDAGERPAPMRGTSRDGQGHALEARQRAEQQQRHEAGHAADVERRQAAQQSRIPESRARFEDKQRKAQERRAQHERQQAEAAASGRTRPAPLPAP